MDDTKKKNDDLIHYGVLGMKWGVRRYQNKDGSLTSAGRKRAEERAEERAERAGLIRQRHYIRQQRQVIDDVRSLDNTMANAARLGTPIPSYTENLKNIIEELNKLSPEQRAGALNHILSSNYSFKDSLLTDLKGYVGTTTWNKWMKEIEYYIY